MRKLTLLNGLLIILTVLSLYYYWFAVADRYIIFLYYHDMGPLFPDTSPFSSVTSSRYWMAGLVAGGAVMFLSIIANWLFGRLTTAFQPPAWLWVWALCAGPLLAGILLITMTVNQPRLPLLNAAQTASAALIGVVLALLPGKLAAKNSSDLIWLGLDGAALMFLLLLIPPAIEDVGRWWISGNLGRVAIVAVGIVIGFAGLLITSGLHIWLRTSLPSALALFVAGLCFAYLLMPLIHHLYVGTIEGHFYISNASNFFARSPWSQFITWLVVGAISVGITQLRRRLVGNSEHSF